MNPTTALMLDALQAARDCIRTDRVALLDAHIDPVTNAVDDDGAAGVAEYDAVLAKIDGAIEAATR